MMPYFYGLYYGKGKLREGEGEVGELAHSADYDVIIFIRAGSGLYSKVGRNETREQSQELDMLMANHLKDVHPWPPLVFPRGIHPNEVLDAALAEAGPSPRIH